MKLLERYIRSIIIEQQAQDNNIVSDITRKFPADYSLLHTPSVPLAADSSRATATSSSWPFLILASDKRDEFLKRYRTDKAFIRQMNSSYTYSRKTFFDFLFPWNELREYLKPELMQAEVIVVSTGKASIISLSDVRSALEIAQSAEELEEMIKVSVQQIVEQHTKAATISESVERRLKINTIISKASRIIMQKLKEFIKSKEDRLAFYIKHNEIPELKEFVASNTRDGILYLDIELSKGAYYDIRGRFSPDENIISIDLSLQAHSLYERALNVIIKEIQDTLRHELEHAVQVIKHGHKEDTKSKYQQRTSEIEAYAVELYRRVLRRANEIKKKMSEIPIITIISAFVENKFADIAFDERAEFKTQILDYMKKRFPLVNQMDMSRT